MLINAAILGFAVALVVLFVAVPVAILVEESRARR